jgi:hypothetical protein
MRGNDAVHLDKALSCRADLNRRIRLSRSRVGWWSSPRAIVQIPMLSMSNSGHYDPFRRPVAAQFVGNDHAWATSVARSSLRKNRIAANRSRFGWTRISMTIPF